MTSTRLRHLRAVLAAVATLLLLTTLLLAGLESFLAARAEDWPRATYYLLLAWFVGWVLHIED